ncbi:YtfJ family protein, partial [Salmonella enterica]|uniref:YtfJ family protein n=1 Tax=Salmonella enterica TaxID=28901 RepID=UPI000A4DB64A
IESNKQQYPWPQFIVDSNGVAQKARKLGPSSPATGGLDKEGRVRYAKDGGLTREEVQQVMILLKQLYSK